MVLKLSYTLKNYFNDYEFLRREVINKLDIRHYNHIRSVRKPELLHETGIKTIE
jgi:cephalosporin hydroxylase